ncbi:unnamed protein product [Nippostrongylus brasiliensis]|uniref:Arrestin_C domain-containing protein n=1 Tax=Nippostrongylus brasiliensis TaxID=27835 RepID=A0A0N4YXR7_NIPBR|nr:unnamed protein product [Nippostrongylus brasiliensis]
MIIQILNFTRPVKYEVEISPRLSYLEQKGDVHIISKKTTIVAEEQRQSAKEIIVTFKPVPKEDLYGVDKGCEVRACESIHLTEKCVKDRGDRGEKKFYLQLPKYNVLYYVAAACATGAGMGPFSHFVTIQIEAPPWATEDVLPKGTEPPSPKPRKEEDDLKPLRLHDVIVDLVAHRGMNIILKWIIVRKDGSDIADSQVKDVVLYQRRRDKSSKTPTNTSIKVLKDLREINIGVGECGIFHIFQNKTIMQYNYDPIL